MSCATFKAAILRRPLNASPAMPKIYGSRGQTAVFRPRRINPCVNLCIKLTANASDASVFSVSLKRSFLTQVYTWIYFHSVPADKSRIPGIGKYCNTATAVSAVGFELDTNTNFEVKRISHKRRKCSGFILTATKVRFCITDTVHFDWNQCSNCRNHCSNYWNQCSFILEYASGDFSLVALLGKGGKTRLCPLLRSSAQALTDLIEGRAAGEAVFLNRRGHPITRSGIRQLVERCAAKAAENIPPLKSRKVGPHVLRHTAATHMLRSGVDLNTVRAWLGHVSLNTTSVYAEIDLERKAKAVALFDSAEPTPGKSYRHNNELMAYLRSL